MSTATAREVGTLSFHPIDRDTIKFAIGDGPWVYTSPAQVLDAQVRFLDSDSDTVRLSGYWLDEQDVNDMAGWVA